MAAKSSKAAKSANSAEIQEPKITQYKQFIKIKQAFSNLLILNIKLSFKINNSIINNL